MARGARSNKPGMAVGSVVGHVIHDNFKIMLMRLGNERVKGCEITEDRVNVGIIGDIVAEIDHRRGVDRRKPDGIHTQPGVVIELGNDTRQITNTVAVAVLEAARVNLIDNSLLPPVRLSLPGIVPHIYTEISFRVAASVSSARAN